jgi:hypothetical protein
VAPGDWAVIDTLPVTGATPPVDLDTYIAGATEYQYRATAQAAGLDDSALSNVATATAPSALTAPTVEANAELTAENESQIWVTVIPPSGADTIRLYRASATGTFSLIRTSDASDADYGDVGVLPGRTYRYYAVALAAGQPNSGASTIASAVAPFPETP